MTDEEASVDPMSVLRAAKPDDELAALAERIDALLFDRGFVPLPAVPGEPDLHAAVLAEDMGFEAFVDVAARVGASLVYRQIETVTDDHLRRACPLTYLALDDQDGETWPLPSDDQDGATGDQSLRHVAKHLVGLPAMVRRIRAPRCGSCLGRHHAVAATVASGDQDDTTGQPARNRLPPAGHFRVPRTCGAVAPGADRCTGRAVVTVTSAQLLPPFHNAHRVEWSLMDHEVIGPLLSSEHRSDQASTQRALAQAWEQVGQDREQAERDLRQRLNDLAAQLAVDTEFRGHNLVDDRRRDADRFLREISGFTLPRTLCTELESRARRLRSQGAMTLL